MIIPNKTTNLKHSLLGQSALLLPQLSRPTTFIELWERVRMNGWMSLPRLELALTFLFAIGAIKMSNGLIETSR